jgi:hypothetical protein
VWLGQETGLATGETGHNGGIVTIGLTLPPEHRWKKLIKMFVQLPVIFSADFNAIPAFFSLDLPLESIDIH